MPLLPSRLAAALAAGVVTVTIAACNDRTENSSGEGSESDDPAATIPTNTEGLGPSDTTPEQAITQERQPLTQTTP